MFYWFYFIPYFIINIPASGPVGIFLFVAHKLGGVEVVLADVGEEDNSLDSNKGSDDFEGVGGGVVHILVGGLLVDYQVFHKYNL